jgi:hypothetical protein
MSAFLLGLFMLAQDLTGYKTQMEMPRLEVVAQEELHLTYCDGQPCNLMGIFNGAGVVLVADTLKPEENPIHASVVLHEFIHALQQDKYHYVMGTLECPEYMVYEKEAYTLQFTYLHMLGIETPPLPDDLFECAEAAK